MTLHTTCINVLIARKTTPRRHEKCNKHATWLKTTKKENDLKIQKLLKILKFIENTKYKNDRIRYTRKSSRSPHALLQKLRRWNDDLCAAPEVSLNVCSQQRAATAARFYLSPALQASLPHAVLPHAAVTLQLQIKMFRLERKNSCARFAISNVTCALTELRIALYDYIE